MANQYLNINLYRAIFIRLLGSDKKVLETAKSELLLIKYIISITCKMFIMKYLNYLLDISKR